MKSFLEIGSLVSTFIIALLTTPILIIGGRRRYAAPIHEVPEGSIPEGFYINEHNKNCLGNCSGSNIPVECASLSSACMMISN